MSQLDKEVVETEDPERFIDLINTMSFSAGNFNGKIPVQRVRTIFFEWLKRHDERKKREILNELNKDLFYYSTQPSGQFIKNTIMEKLGERPDVTIEAKCQCENCKYDGTHTATPKRPAPNPPNKIPRF